MKNNPSRIELRIDPPTAYDPARLKSFLAKQIGVDPGRVADVIVIRRSIDARQKRVMVNLTVDAYIDRPAPPLEQRIQRDTELSPLHPLPDDAPRAIVVGCGPAGLFAARRLLELGIRPVVLERGKDVDSRRLDVAQIARTQKVDPESNYCFGEGGAGTFSDGKLYTRSHKRGPVDKVLATLVLHGADPAILADAHPHIGTDKLPYIIRNMRMEIERMGGEVHFRTRVDRILAESTPQGLRTTGVEATHTDDEGRRQTLSFTGSVILATGHSARDIYRSLDRDNIDLEAKGLAIGVRLEHPQQLIDSIFYHNPAGRGKWLPAAEYSLLTRVDGRAVYSFCMCPGGVIVPAATGPGQIVVNGMSSSARSSRHANSGMVVEVLPEDIPGNGRLRLMDYQQSIESRFSQDAGGTLNCAAQRMTDFCGARPSRDLPAVSYPPGVHPGRVDKLLPPEISKRLRRGFEEFGLKYRGFLTPEATVVGCETRTSSPVRITRDKETLMSTNTEGLYPCGEGAGYAGGIVSAAIDGIRCAESLAKRLQHN